MRCYHIVGIVVLSALSACKSMMFPFDFTELAAGPTKVGPEWAVFSFTPPMDARYRQKGVLLELPPTAKWGDVNRNGVVTLGNEKTMLVAEAIGTDDKVYPLPFVGPMIPTGYPQLYVVLLSQDFPQPVQLKAVRVQSSEPATFGRVLWENATPE